MSYKTLCKIAEYFEDRARRARQPANHERLTAVAKKYRLRAEVQRKREKSVGDAWKVWAQLEGAFAKAPNCCKRGGQTLCLASLPLPRGFSLRGPSPVDSRTDGLPGALT